MELSRIYDNNNKFIDYVRDGKVSKFEKRQC